jgi:hypothetical protein
MRLAMVFCLAIAIASGPSISNAWPGWGGWGHHDRYRYHDGGWWLGGAVVTGLAVGAIIESLPPRHDILYVGGNPYYFDGTYYYQQTPQGYVVVQPYPQPVVIQQSQLRVVEPPAVVQGVPPGFLPVIVNHSKYYLHNGTWYIYTSSGLLRVEDPTK